MPQTQAFYEDGSPIPEDKLGEALANGQALFEKGAAIQMRDAYGRPTKVAAADINQALHAGFSLQSSADIEREAARQQYGEDLGQTAVAAAEGAGRGLSFGLTDELGSAIGGEDYRKAALARQEFNPVAAGAGEVAGAVAPMLLSGGTGAVAKGAGALGMLPRGAAAIGRGVEAGVMGGLEAAGYEGASVLSRAAARTAALGLSGAAEGSLYGAGKAISDTALKGEDLTAEKILSSMGSGALYGGAAGAILGASGSLLSSAGEKLGGMQAVKGYAGEIRDASVLDALGTNKAGVKKIIGNRVGENADQKLSEFARDVFDYKFEDGRRLFGGARSPAEMAGDVSAAVEETGAKLRALKGELDAAIGERPELAPDINGWLDKVDNTVLADMKRSTSHAERMRARAVEQELQHIRERVAPPTPSLLDEVSEAGADSTRINLDGMRDLTTHRGAYAGATPEEVKQIALGQVPTKNSRNAFEPIRINVEPDGSMVLNDGHHRLAAAKEAGATEIQARVVRHDADGNPVAEMTGPVSIEPRTQASQPVSFLEADQIRRRLRDSFQTPSGAPIPEAKHELERAERMLSDTIAESGEGALSALGKDPATWREMNRRMSHLMTAEKITSDAATRAISNRKISPSDYATGIASALGAMASGNVGAIASMATGGAAAVAHKLIRERGRTVVAQLADRVAKLDITVGKAAEAMAGIETAATTAAAPIAVEAGSLSERYRRAADAVRTMAADPKAAVAVSSAVTAHYAETYPDLAGSVQGQVLGDVQYLASRLPPQMTRADASLTPTVVTPRAPASQMRKFLAAVDALDSPASVVEALARGKMPPRDAVEALKERRPQLFNDLRTKVVLACLKRDRELDYQRRILLSLVFDFRGDKSLQPQYMATVQRSFAPPPKLKLPPPSRRGVAKAFGDQMTLKSGVDHA